ncbi:unnamed protein product [Closterium sp. NIES-54]
MPDVKADSLERRKPRAVAATSPQFSNSTYAFPRHVRAPVFNASDSRTRKTRSRGPLKADPDVGRELLEILRKGDSLSGDFPVMSPPSRSTNPIVNDNNFRRSSAFSSQMPALDFPRLETCKAPNCSAVGENRHTENIISCCPTSLCIDCTDSAAGKILAAAAVSRCWGAAGTISRRSGQI